MANEPLLSEDERVWTKIESQVPGVERYRRMTAEEIEKYNVAKDKSRVKVQPAEIEGFVPKR